jgi:serine protease
VAGIISAATNNGVGVAGVCWNCRILVNQVFDSGGSGSHENFRDGMIFSTDYGADLVNYSGGGSDSETKEHGVAYADSHDVLLVAAAGNSWGGSVSYPAAYSASYDNVICVSSTDADDQVSPFSSIGSQVNVAAPGGYGSPYDGDDIYSTMPNYTVTLNSYGISENYGYCAGTSMASPMVAGLAALVLSVNPALLPLQVRETLEETAEQVGGYTYDPVTGKCNQLGHGRVNAYDAVLLAMQGSYLAGDANGDELVDVADPIYILNYLYKGNPAPVPLAAGDANADCVVDVSDVVYLLNYLYKAGPPPREGCA